VGQVFVIEELQCIPSSSEEHKDYSIIWAPDASNPLQKLKISLEFNDNIKLILSEECKNGSNYLFDVLICEYKADGKYIAKLSLVVDFGSIKLDNLKEVLRSAALYIKQQQPQPISLFDTDVVASAASVISKRELAKPQQDVLFAKCPDTV